MSKFLSAMSDEEEEEQQVQEQQQQFQEQEQQTANAKAKNAKKKDKKNKKKAELDELDAILGPQAKKDEPLEEIKEQVETVAVETAVEEKTEKQTVAEGGESKTSKKKKKGDKAADQQTQQAPAAKKPEKEKPMTAIAKKALEQRLAKEKEEQRIKEEMERLQREEDERIRAEEERERIRKEEEEKRREEKKRKVEQLKKEGKYMTKKQKEEQARLEQLRSQFQPQTEEVVDRSNVVRRTKRKPQDKDQTPQEEKPKVQEVEQQKEPSPQKQNVAPVVVETPAQNVVVATPAVQAPQTNGEEIDDWETAFNDEPEAAQGTQVSQSGGVQQIEEKKDVGPQQTQQQLQRQEDQRKFDNKVNKELYDMYQQRGELRSPICCILGHVDTGKTTLLDKIRNTNVQEGEAGGITQQIGATFFPGKKLIEELKKTQAFYPVDCNVPGLLIIDTPGHESFSNLRSRGSSLCDLAILVVDLMHGLENQTLESLELLKQRKTPFVIALNKIDRCFEWAKRNMGSSYDQLQKQKKSTKGDYEHRRQQIFTQLAEKGFNVTNYWENDDPASYVSVIPTSGITGEGIPDILSVIVKYTSVFLRKRITIKNTLNCTVLELKVIDGFGPTIDCILVDGILRRDDRIVIQGFHGPIITKIKAVLTPHPMKEMRVKGEYINHEVMYASMGVKIAALDLEDAVVGSQLYVVNDEESLSHAKQLLANDYEQVKQKIQLSPTGIGVVASTLGSLEALLEFLKKSNIPVSYVSVGPVSKEDVMKTVKNIITEEPKRRKQEYACVLVFDIKVLPEARDYAAANQIKIFEAKIIYHLFDAFTAYVKQIQDDRKAQEGKDAVFPCQIKILTFFNKKDPIIMGVDIEKGILRPGTPICVLNEGKLKVGVVESIEANHKNIKEARSSHGSVAIRVKTDGTITAGRQFEATDKLVSMISRHSIDVLKTHFREDLTLDDWQLVKDLKEFFNII